MGLARYESPRPEDKDVLLPLGNYGESKLVNNKLKVLVWNIKKGEMKDFQKDFRNLSVDKDLLILQENYLTNTVHDTLIERPDLGYESASSFFYGKERIRTGVATGSILKPFKTRFLRTIILEPILNSPKISLITEHQLNKDKTLTVVNVHAINFVKPLEFLFELNRLRDLIKQLPRPLILAGDFNTWIGERIFYLDQIRRELNLKSANFSPDFRKTFNGNKLDHVLYSNDLELISAEASNQYLGSDHAPLELEFFIK